MPNKERFKTQTKESARLSVSLVALHAPKPLPQTIQKPKFEPKTELKQIQKPLVAPKKTVVKKEILPEKKVQEKIIEQPLVAEKIPQEETTQEVLEPLETAPPEIHAIEATQQPIQTAQAIQKSEPSLVDTKALEAKRNLFIEQMRQAIDKNKIYPNSARRRAIEGEVKMSFTLQADGSVRDIQILLGKSIFEDSAKEAITKSFPLHGEKELFSFPKEFQITLVYTLKS
jgi:protein TonB